METEVTMVLRYFPSGQMRKLTRQSETQGWSLEPHSPKSPRPKDRVDAKGPDGRLQPGPVGLLDTIEDLGTSTP